jgi:hypothetical protein
MQEQMMGDDGFKEDSVKKGERVASINSKQIQTIQGQEMKPDISD